MVCLFGHESLGVVVRRSFDLVLALPSGIIPSIRKDPDKRQFGERGLPRSRGVYPPQLARLTTQDSPMEHRCRAASRV